MTTLRLHNILDHLAISEMIYKLVRHIEAFVTLASSTLSSWKTRSLSRQQLAQMSDWLLADIGLNRADAIAEAKKRFWQA